MKFKTNFKLTKLGNFWINEFLSDEDKYTPTAEQISKITRVAECGEKFRGFVKKNMYVTSGIRSVAYNKKVKGDVDSYHLQGLAMDCELGYWKGKTWVEDYGTWTMESLLPIAEASGFSNIGFYIGSDGKFKWLHLDCGTPREHGKYGWIKYSDTLSYKIHNV